MNHLYRKCFQIYCIVGAFFFASFYCGEPCHGQPKKASAEGDVLSLVSTASPVQLSAFRLIEGEKNSEAKKILLDALSKPDVTDQAKEELLYFLAFIELKEDNHDMAIKYLARIEKLFDSLKTPNLLKQAILEKRTGDCYYAQREIDKALTNYRSALTAIGYFRDQVTLQRELLDSLSGCELMKKNYEDSLEYLEEINGILQQRVEEDNLADFISYFWNNIQLAQVYGRLGQNQKALACNDIVHDMLKKFTSYREQLDKSGELEGLRHSFTYDYLKRARPSSIADCLWLAEGCKLKSLPLITWSDKEKPINGIILCIHGMGLENRAYTLFAKEMVKRGYLVAALDVRGFGAWLYSPGHERIGFSETIEDIDYVIKFLKKEHAGIPVFLLGESMGGAIALRTVAELGGIVNGVIASVPSAERYNEGKMALDVAIHFLKNPNKPYEIIEEISKQATKRPTLRSFWTEDQKAKSHASPKELIKFDKFMRRTVGACKKIKDTPVLIVQGLGDELVKPKGTVEMFKRVRHKDKTLLIIGEAEHLIFESDIQNIMLLNTLTDWMIDRRELNRSAPIQTSSK